MTRAFADGDNHGLLTTLRADSGRLLAKVGVERGPGIWTSAVVDSHLHVARHGRPRQRRPIRTPVGTQHLARRGAPQPTTGTAGPRQFTLVARDDAGPTAIRKQLFAAGRPVETAGDTLLV